MKQLLLVITILMFVWPVLAQDGAAEEDCPAIISETLLTAAEACSETATGETCYGSREVSATFSGGATSTFNAPGDRIATDDIATLTFGPASDDGTWGSVVIVEETYWALMFGGATYDKENQTFTPEGKSACEDANAGILLEASEPSTITINDTEIAFEGAIGVAPTGPDDTLQVASLNGITEVVLADGSSYPIEVGTMLDSGLPDETEPVSTNALELYYNASFNGLFGSSAGGSENYPTPALSATPITPHSGVWEVVSTSAYIYSGCPDGLFAPLSERVNQIPPPTFATFDFSDGVSIPTWVEQQTGNSPPPDAIYLRPAPNWYHAIDTPPIEFSLYIVSDAEIVTQTIWGDDRCLRISFDYWEYRGD